MPDTPDEMDYTGHVLSLNNDEMVNILSRLSLPDLIKQRRGKSAALNPDKFFDKYAKHYH